MITPELLKDPYYHLVLRLCDKIRKTGDLDAASTFQMFAETSEMPLGLYSCMEYLAKHDISVSEADYEMLRHMFGHEDEPDWDPQYDELVSADEAELTLDLRVADE